jgi:hypothetical protein
MLRIDSTTRCCCALLAICVAGRISQGELVAHWPLLESDTDLFEDRIAGNNGFLPEGVTVDFVEDGPLDFFTTSVLFTGDDGPSYIETPFPGIGGANPRTVAMWVKADPQTRATAVLGWGPNRTAEKWHFRIEDTRIRTEYSGGQKFGGDTDIADGQWHHIASVFPEGAIEGEEIIHYVDGEVEPHLGGTSIEINTGIPPADGADPVFIGFASVHAGRWFQGQIADVRIYDEGLDRESIQAIMTGVDLAPPGDPGDFNLDGVVDSADFAIMAANFNQRFSTTESFEKGDFDLNGRVNMKDFIRFRDLYQSQPAAAASVPEPGALGLAVMAVGLIGLLRRRQR